MSRDALKPAPKVGDVLAMYSNGIGGETRYGLHRISHVTATGQMVVGGSRFDASGREMSARTSTRSCVRWPTDLDSQDARRKRVVEALLRVAWGARTDEEREAVVDLLGIEVAL